MAPRKRTIKSKTSKGKAIKIAGHGLPALQRSAAYHQGYGLLSPSELTASVQPSQQCEDHLLQMLYEMKEQTKEQQAESDREREQMILDRKNVLQKYLKELIQQGLLKEYVLEPEAASRQSHPQPSYP